MGLTIYDITAPHAPLKTGNFYHTWGAEDIAMIGDSLVFGEYNRMDITDPENANVTNYYEGIPLLYETETDGALIYGAWDNHWDDEYWFSVVDITQPQGSELVATIPMPDIVQDIAVKDGYAYLACDSGYFLVVDVDPPETANIVLEVSEIETARCVALSESYAYIGDNSKISVIDITDPENAFKAYEFSVSSPGRLLANGDYLYGLRYGFLQVMDISDPGNISLLSEACIGDASYPAAIEYFPGYCVVANGKYNNDTSTLKVVNVQDPSQPFAAEEIDVYIPLDIALVDNILYVADKKSGIRIFSLW